MKIAYILLCHKNPLQVIRLIERLNTDLADLYIHVDKKNTTFDLPAFENVFVLPSESRVDVRWARKSMVEATLSAINYMFAGGRQYDYVFLLSGQDYPIKTNIEIADFLCKSNGSNFIEVIDHAHPMYKRYSKRAAIYYPAWMQNRTFISRAAKKLYIYLTGGYQHTFSVCRRKNGTGLTFEFGSQWWCLTFECLTWIYNYVVNHPEFLDFFDHALTPDESFFQTLFMISPYCSTRKDKLTYLEWDKNQNNPRIFRENDILTLTKSEYLFARKFDIDIDCKAIDLLEYIAKGGDPS